MLLDYKCNGERDFLAFNNDENLHTLADVEGSRISPHPPGSLPDRYTGFDDDTSACPDIIRRSPQLRLDAIPQLSTGLAGLMRTRREDVDAWMDRLGLDVIVFPAVADVGPADADVDEASP